MNLSGFTQVMPLEVSAHRNIFIVGKKNDNLNTLYKIAKHYELKVSQLRLWNGKLFTHIFPTDSLAYQTLPNGKIVYLPYCISCCKEEKNIWDTVYTNFKQKFPEIKLKLGDTLDLHGFSLDTINKLSQAHKNFLTQHKSDSAVSVHVLQNHPSFQFFLPDNKQDIIAVGRIKLNDYLTGFIISYDLYEIAEPHIFHYLYVFDNQGFMVQDPLLLQWATTHHDGNYALHGKIFKYNGEKLCVFSKYWFSRHHPEYRKEAFMFNYTDSEKYRQKMDIYGNVELFTRFHLMSVYKEEVNEILDLVKD
jgi:hypothetical protein